MNYLTISKVAKELGVSIEILRRGDKEGENIEDNSKS